MAILNQKCFAIAIAKKSLNFKLFKNCHVLLKQASSQCFIPEHLPTGSSTPEVRDGERLRDGLKTPV